jgi:hypothetical protein
MLSLASPNQLFLGERQVIPGDNRGDESRHLPGRLKVTSHAVRGRFATTVPSEGPTGVIALLTGGLLIAGLLAE